METVYQADDHDHDLKLAGWEQASETPGTDTWLCTYECQVAGCNYRKQRFQRETVDLERGA